MTKFQKSPDFCGEIGGCFLPCVRNFFSVILPGWDGILSEQQKIFHISAKNLQKC